MRLVQHSRRSLTGWRLAMGVFMAAIQSTVWGVEPGESLEAIIEELGAPVASIRINDMHVYYFEAGQVEVHRGSVTDVRVVPERNLRATSRHRRERVGTAGTEQTGRDSLEEDDLGRRVRGADAWSGRPERQVASRERFRRADPPDLRLEDSRRASRQRSLEQERTQRRIAELERRVRKAEAQVARPPTVYVRPPANPYFYGGVVATYGYTPNSVATVRGGYPKERVCRPGHQVYRRSILPSRPAKIIGRPRRHPASWPTVSTRADGFGYQRPLAAPSARAAGTCRTSRAQYRHPRGAW